VAILFILTLNLVIRYLFIILMQKILYLYIIVSIHKGAKLQFYLK